MLNQNMKSVFLYFEFQTSYQADFDFDHFFINFYIFVIFQNLNAVKILKLAIRGVQIS